MKHPGKILLGALFLAGLLFALGGCASDGAVGGGVYYGTTYPGPWFDDGPWVYGHHWYHDHPGVYIHPPSLNSHPRPHPVPPSSPRPAPRPGQRPQPHDHDRH